MIALSFRDGRSVAVMDLAPRGDTTEEETEAPASKPIIDERIQFGALGAREVPEGGVELGFWLPGTTESPVVGRRGAPANPIVRRRYHPVKAGFSQSYQVAFRFGQGGIVPRHGTRRLALGVANAETEGEPIDVETARRALIDHMDDRVVIVTKVAQAFRSSSIRSPASPARIAGCLRVLAVRVLRLAGPTAPARQVNVPLPRSELSPEDGRALAEWARGLGVDYRPPGFVSWLGGQSHHGLRVQRHRVGGQVARERATATPARAARRSRSTLAIIDTFIRLVPMWPPAGEGFNLWTGKPGTAARAFSASGRRRKICALWWMPIAARSGWGANTRNGCAGACSWRTGCSSSSAQRAPSPGAGFRGRDR